MRRGFRNPIVGMSVVAVVAALYFFGTIDAHQANLRYILWKHHVWPFQKLMLPYLSVDGEFTMSLTGKSRAEVQRFFPTLIPPERATLPSQQYYSREILAQGAEVLWIGDSDFAVRLENGKVTYVGPIKG